MSRSLSASKTYQKKSNLSHSNPMKVQKCSAPFTIFVVNKFTHDVNTEIPKFRHCSIPPLPKSSIIWYLPAKVVPPINSWMCFSSVLVTGISSEETSWIPHSLQNFCVSGLSAWHLGHFIPVVPFACLTKEYQLTRKGLNLVWPLRYSFMKFC